MKYDFFLLLLSGSQAFFVVYVLETLRPSPSLSLAAAMLLIPCAVCGVCAAKLGFKFYFFCRKGKTQ